MFTSEPRDWIILLRNGRSVSFRQCLIDHDGGKPYMMVSRQGTIIGKFLNAEVVGYFLDDKAAA